MYRKISFLDKSQKRLGKMAKNVEDRDDDTAGAARIMVMTSEMKLEEGALTADADIGAVQNSGGANI